MDYIAHRVKYIKSVIPDMYNNNFREYINFQGSNC